LTIAVGWSTRRRNPAPPGVKASVQFRTAGLAAAGYTRRMASANLKTSLFVAWVIAVCLGAIVLGVTSLQSWLVVVCAAIAPPLVVRQFWRAPEQTISESINEARR